MLTCEAMRIAQDGFELRADLAIARDAVTAVIGPSGGGKSTLLAGIAGFIPLAEGRVLWDGTDLTDLGPGQRPISILFQDNNLFPHLTVAQNVGLGLRPDLKLRGSDADRVSRALDSVGLEGYAARKPSTLSGGQQSRVALARVLVAERPLVLLDEPFAALGPGLKAQMLGIVRDVLLAAGKTVVMVTHDPSDAKAVADAVVLVADGRAAQPVETASLFADPPASLREYLGESG